MDQVVTETGWIAADGMILLCPVTGFKIQPGGNGVCALQFTYFKDRDAQANNDVRVLQLSMPLDGIAALREALQKAEAQLQSTSGGAAG